MIQCHSGLQACALTGALLVFMPAQANAQATGTISGTVTDASNAVLRGVAVEVTNPATGLARTTSTGPDGFYTVPLLPPGVYEVKGARAGFSTLIRKGVRVSVAETARVDLTLPVTRVMEEVTVTGDAPLVETGNATLGIVIGERTITDLPLNGRSFAQLGTLVPGVVAPPPALGGAAGDATTGSGFAGNPTGSFNVNGMRNTSNNFLLDGATNNDTFNTGFVLRPPPDAIQEFKILTHSYNAEYGRNAGSVVDVVTKSGTNIWHGAAWEFNRDDSLQARNFFAPRNQPKPALSQNQFGVTIGGPIVRNKLLAFGYYEGYRNRTGTTNVFIVPTAAQRAGDFSAGAPVRDPDTGLPFAGNVIPASRLDPIALRLLTDFVPLPNDGPNRYTASPTVADDRDQAGLRLDYRPSSKHSLLARYLWNHTMQETPATIQPSAQVAKATLQDVMLSDTYMWSANVINVARLSFNLIDANPAVTSGRRNSEYGINLPNANPAAVGLAALTLTGVFPANIFGDVQQALIERANHVLQISDDFSWLRGRHAFKFGVDIRRERMSFILVNRANGDVIFSGGITGNPIADFLLGRPAQVRASTAHGIQDGHGWLFAGYAQDQFRISSRLTLNAGLRYELPIPFVDKHDAIAGIDMAKQSVRYPGAPRGLIYPGDPGVPRGVIPTDTNNIAPRLGLIWDPTGKGRTSVRAAWGMFFDTLWGQGDFYLSGVSPPFTPVVQVNTPTPITLADPLAALAGGQTLFPPNLTLLGWGTDFQSPYAYHYNLGVQHQFGNDLGVELGYVGSRGEHQPIFIEINPGVYEPGQTTRGARVFPAYALVRPTFSAARSWYDALQASARLRLTRGLDFLASYTWSHAIDHASALAMGSDFRPMLPAVQGDEASVAAVLAREKGDAQFDVRHRFVVSFGYRLPTPWSHRELANAILGGWQVHGIVQAQTGFPLTVTEATNLDIRYMMVRPDVICDPNRGPKTPAEWFDTGCFARRTLAQTGERPGNGGRSTVRGPGFSRTDVSLLKDFEIAARHRIQFRVEAFNLFNQTRLGPPGYVIGTPTFGVITTTDGDNRILQLGIKYIF